MGARLNCCATQSLVTSLFPKKSHPRHLAPLRSAIVWCDRPYSLFPPVNAVRLSCSKCRKQDGGLPAFHIPSLPTEECWSCSRDNPIHHCCVKFASYISRSSVPVGVLPVARRSSSAVTHRKDLAVMSRHSILLSCIIAVCALVLIARPVEGNGFFPRHAVKRQTTAASAPVNETQVGEANTDLLQRS